MTLPDAPQPSRRGGPPDEYRAELLWVIGNAIRTAPRSQQRRLGPSEIGNPCARRLGYKLAGVEPQGSIRTPWKSTIGEAVHQWLEEVFRRTNKYMSDGDEPRFLLEGRVVVGQICGEDIDGKCDLYDRKTATVTDWKIVGTKTLRRYRKHGPGQQYRVQCHLYGRGWQNRGLPVDRVSIYFLPRDLEIDKAYFWSEPYNEQIALDALSRAEAITQLVTSGGREVLPLLPTANVWCGFCPYYRPWARDITEACPGHEEKEKTK